jgi:hypothetical protein
MSHHEDEVPVGVSGRLRQYVHALDDLAALCPNAPTTDLYARFMGWLLERRRGGR